MTLQISSSTLRLIEKKMTSGKFDAPEAVVLAGLAALDQKPLGDFAPGELNRLLAEGEQSVQRHGTFDGGNALATRRKRRKRTRGAA
jgi:hypothetical protein